MKRLPLMMCVLLLSSMAGCGPSAEELRAQEEQAQQERIEREKAEQKQREHNAMHYATRYDQELMDQIADSRTLGEVVFGAKDETMANYVRNLKRVPLDECPADFREAYEAHIEAWESRNESRIKATWMDVVAIARLHGVTVPE